MARRAVICLDTNYLILGLIPDSTEAHRLLAWSDQGTRFCTSAIVWYEFCCGPVNLNQVQAMRQLLQEIIPFDNPLADEAARLFNATGRKRQRRVDTMIAATAIVHGTSLATNNQADFAPFVEHGLQLMA